MSSLVRYMLMGKKFAGVGLKIARIVRVQKCHDLKFRELPKEEEERLEKEICYPIVQKLKEPTEKKVRYFMIWFVVGCGVATGSGFLWINHRDIVPITGRHHTIFVSKETEIACREIAFFNLGYKKPHPVTVTKDGEETVITTDTLNGKAILHDKNDTRVQMVMNIYERLKRACIYFSPQSEHFFNEIQFFIVDNPEKINAFSALGGVVVVYTGLINFYMECYEKGLIKDVETSIAGILAHELAHALASHSVESTFHLSTILFYFLMFALNDVFIVPMVMEFVDLTRSQRYEKEADIMSMYIQKRAGYDISQWAQTLKLLKPENESLYSDHPLTARRVKYVKQAIPQVEKDFQEKYCIEEKIKDTEKGVVYSVLDSIFNLFCLASSLIVYWNKEMINE